MQVGWQDEGNALQPFHHGYCLWLSGLCDVDKLVRKVPVQVKIVAVVASSVTPHITWEETGVNEEWATRSAPIAVEKKKVDFLPLTLTFPPKNRLASFEQHAIKWSNYCSGPVMLSPCSCAQTMIPYTCKFSLCTIKVILHFCVLKLLLCVSLFLPSWAAS